MGLMACCDACLMLMLNFLKFEFSALECITVQNHLLWFKIIDLMSITDLETMLYLEYLLILTCAEGSLLKKQYHLFFKDLKVELIRTPLELG